MDKNQGLFEIFKFNERDISLIDNWYFENENILELKMEEITQTPLESSIEIFRFLGLLDESENNNYQLFKIKALLNRALNKYSPLNFRLKQKATNKQHLASLNERLNFKKLSKGRRIGQENTKSHYRKGKQGDWKNHFNAEHTAFFKDKYGDLLIKLGYEKDYNW